MSSAEVSIAEACVQSVPVEVGSASFNLRPHFPAPASVQIVQLERLKAAFQRFLGRIGKEVSANPKFECASEAVCAFMLEYYQTSFKLKHGKSYQIPIGQTEDGHVYRVDFSVGPSIVEFHAPRFPRRGKLGDFDSHEERRNFYREKRALPVGERKAFETERRQEAMQRYALERRSLLDSNDDYRHRELIVTKDAAEFYDKVLRRFAHAELPDRTSFVDYFHELRRLSAKLQKKAEK